jgi:hypothetical protein
MEVRGHLKTYRPWLPGSLRRAARTPPASANVIRQKHTLKSKAETSQAEVGVRSGIRYVWIFRGHL